MVIISDVKVVTINTTKRTLLPVLSLMLSDDTSALNIFVFSPPQYQVLKWNNLLTKERLSIQFCIPVLVCPVEYEFICSNIMDLKHLKIATVLPNTSEQFHTTIEE